jgi:hypothetical protein
VLRLANIKRVGAALSKGWVRQLVKGGATFIRTPGLACEHFPRRAHQPEGRDPGYSTAGPVLLSQGQKQQLGWNTIIGFHKINTKSNLPVVGRVGLGTTINTFSPNWQGRASSEGLFNVSGSFASLYAKIHCSSASPDPMSMEFLKSHHVWSEPPPPAFHIFFWSFICALARSVQELEAWLDLDFPLVDQATLVRRPKTSLLLIEPVSDLIFTVFEM